MPFVLERLQRVARPLADVFDFFARAENLEAITPPFLHFAFLTALPIEMKVGALIDYRIRLYGVPMRWRTRIDVWEPGERFVDTQLRGPYRLWRHLHEFRALGPDATEVKDRVEYELPFGPLGRLVHAAFVRATLARIFDHRRERVAALLEGVSAKVAARGSR
jgi:ligand-binding SRPBCC domain-containing protein